MQALAFQRQLCADSIDLVLFTEVLAGKVHSRPDGDGKHEVERVLHGRHQRLPEKGHHGHHHALAQQHGDKVALLVKIRDAKGKVHKGRGRKGQERQHEQGRGVKPADPLLRLLQLGGAAGKFPEKTLDDTPPEQEHHSAAQHHPGPAVHKAQKPAVGRNIQRHNGKKMYRNSR